MSDSGFMDITRRSLLTMREKTMRLRVTQPQLQAFYNGMYEQDAFPDLSSDERQFVATGITPEEMDIMFK